MLSLAAVLLAVVLLAGSVSSRVDAADLSKDITAASDATPYTATIHSYIAAKAVELQSPDGPKVKSARESLVEEMRGITPPSASFADVYCGELAVQLMPLTSNAEPRVRLNVAISVARVAERAQDASGRLAPLIVALLKDSNNGIVLWALRGAKYVVVPVLNVRGTNDKLVPAIVDAAKRGNDGAIVGAAYEALTSDLNNPTALPIYITAVTDLLDFRLKQYGAALPPEPPMDNRATAFLVDRKIWALPTTKKPETVQRIVDLIYAAANGFITAQGVEKDELSKVIADAANAIRAIGFTQQNAALQAGMLPLTTVNSRMTPAALTQNVDAAVTIVISVFPTVHKPASSATSGANSSTKAAPIAPANPTPSAGR